MAISASVDRNPTVEDYEDSDDGVRTTKLQANTSLKRTSHSSDLSQFRDRDGRSTPVADKKDTPKKTSQQTPSSVPIDLRSDSGYSSRTQATNGSTDSSITGRSDRSTSSSKHTVKAQKAGVPDAGPSMRKRAATTANDTISQPPLTNQPIQPFVIEEASDDETPRPARTRSQKEAKPKGTKCAEPNCDKCVAARAKRAAKKAREAQQSIERDPTPPRSSKPRRESHTREERAESGRRSRQAPPPTSRRRSSTSAQGHYRDEHDDVRAHIRSGPPPSRPPPHHAHTLPLYPPGPQYPSHMMYPTGPGPRPEMLPRTAHSSYKTSPPISGYSYNGRNGAAPPQISARRVAPSSTELTRQNYFDPRYTPQGHQVVYDDDDEEEDEDEFDEEEEEEDDEDDLSEEDDSDVSEEGSEENSDEEEYESYSRASPQAQVGSEFERRMNAAAHTARQAEAARQMPPPQWSMRGPAQPPQMAGLGMSYVQTHPNYADPYHTAPPGLNRRPSAASSSGRYSHPTTSASSPNMESPSMRHRRPSRNGKEPVHHDTIDAMVQQEIRREVKARMRDLTVNTAPDDHLDHNVRKALRHQSRTEELAPHAKTPLTATALRKKEGLPSDAGSHRTRTSENTATRRHRATTGEGPEGFKMRMDLLNGMEFQVGGYKCTVPPGSDGNFADLIIENTYEADYDRSTTKGSVKASSRAGGSKLGKHDRRRREEELLVDEEDRDRDRRAVRESSMQVQTGEPSGHRKSRRSRHPAANIPEVFTDDDDDEEEAYSDEEADDYPRPSGKTTRRAPTSSTSARRAPQIVEEPRRRTRDRHVGAY